MFSSLLDWMPWIISGGTVTWIALAVFAPRILDIVSPILKGLAEFVVEFVKRLWDGFLDIIDNINAIIFVIVSCLIWSWYTHPEPKVVYKDKATISNPKKATKESNKPTFSLQGWDWFHSK